METLSEDLEPITTRDETLLTIRDQMGALIVKSKSARKLDSLDVALVELSFAPPAMIRRWKIDTDSCMALLEHNTVIVNQEFMYQVEIAVRSFALAGQVTECHLLRNDENMFALVRRAQTDPVAYVNRLRRLHALAGTEQRVRREVAMALLFFVAHEIGHLLDGNDMRNFTTFVKPEAPLETRLAAATSKFWRHYEELKEYGFDLTDLDREGKGKVRTEAEKVLKSIPEHEAINQEVWFADETSADEKAVQILLECLELSDDDESSVDFALACKALFAVSMFSWYKDLLFYVRKSGLPPDIPASAQQLAIAMAKHRNQYIQAASLFGEVHRFTLLRANLAMESILQAYTDFFSTAEEDRSIRYDGPDLRKHEIADALQRYYLTCLLMDTAVKLATTGAATAWMLNMDAKRGTPQTFMMHFYPLADEMNRLRQFQ